MQPEIALTKREQMLQDGYCFVDDILTEEFLQELRDESERLIAAHVPPPDVRYQGQHVDVRGEENDIIKRLLEWQPARAALEELGFGDFESTGGIIILTKDPGEPALYWHQDWAELGGSDQHHALAAADLRLLLSERHQRRERLSQGHPRHAPQAYYAA